MATVQVYNPDLVSRLYDASGTITTGGTAQLVLPQAKTRTSLIIENISAYNMFLEFGAARATAVVTNGVVTSATVTNAGQGYSLPPQIKFLGGLVGSPLNPNTTSYTPTSLPDWSPANNMPSAHCVMTGTAPNKSVSSIVIDSGGSLLNCPPYMLLTNDPLDPFGGCIASATNGILLLANGGSYTANGSVCTPDAISIFCATTGAAFTCKYTL